MTASVQGWRKKWFYIKDRKIASSDQYGVAPFDANQRLEKLASWDSPPMDFCSLFSDNENPRKDAATAPLVDAPVADELPSQEAVVVAKSLEAAVQKSTSSRASKCLKKAPMASTSLDTHRPVSSTDDVSTAFLWPALFTT
jgi:hypothetical protein